MYTLWSKPQGLLTKLLPFSCILQLLKLYNSAEFFSAIFCSLRSSFSTYGLIKAEVHYCNWIISSAPSFQSAADILSRLHFGLRPASCTSQPLLSSALWNCFLELFLLSLLQYASNNDQSYRCRYNYPTIVQYRPYPSSNAQNSYDLLAKIFSAKTALPPISANDLIISSWFSPVLVKTTFNIASAFLHTYATLN